MKPKVIVPNKSRKYCHQHPESSPFVSPKNPSKLTKKHQTHLVFLSSAKKFMKIILLLVLANYNNRPKLLAIRKLDSKCCEIWEICRIFGEIVKLLLGTTSRTINWMIVILCRCCCFLVIFRIFLGSFQCLGDA